MINILGIDYGKAKVGLAISSGTLAAPLTVLRYENIDELLVRIKKVVEEEKVERIVIGLSDGQIAKESKNFGEKLSKYLSLPVSFIDETLTTVDVQQKAIEAGMKRKKRKNMEDAFSATMILQNYLDNV